MLFFVEIRLLYQSFRVRFMRMHIYFSGIGGTGIGPLAIIAQSAGLSVSGSDKQHSKYTD